MTEERTVFHDIRDKKLPADIVYEDDDVEVKILEDEETFNSCCAEETKVDQIVPKDSQGDLVQEFCDIRSRYNPDEWPFFFGEGADGKPGPEFDRKVKKTSQLGNFYAVTQRIEESNIKVEDPFIVKLITKEPDKDLDYLTMDEILNAPQYVDLPKTPEEFDEFSGSIFGILLVDAFVLKANASSYRVSTKIEYIVVDLRVEGDGARDDIIRSELVQLNGSTKAPFFIMTDKSVVDKQYLPKPLEPTEECP